MAHIARPAILTYHSLDDSGSVISITARAFAAQMEFLARNGIPVAPLCDVPSRPGSVALTFDDAFGNFAEKALPILEKHRFPATVFVVTGFCGKFNDWDRRGASIPRLPLLSWGDLASMPRRISVGAHTVTHRVLTGLSEPECEDEMRHSREEIEQRLGRSVPCLAYPYGISSAAVRRVAAYHFTLSLGTTLGLLPVRYDNMDLPRIDAYYFRSEAGFKLLFSAAGPPYISIRNFLRKARKRLLAT